MSESVEAPKERKPRFSLENPGDLAVLESEWLKANKGLEVTPEQVRGVLMFHGEFQKSPERKAQVENARHNREADAARRKQERADAKAAKQAAEEAKKAEKAAKKTKAEDDGVAAVADAIESDSSASAVPEGPGPEASVGTVAPKPKKTSRLRPSRAKAATAPAEF